MRQRWRTSWQKLQSNQLFPLTLMLSSRLIGSGSQWLRLLSPRLPEGAVLIISQPARLNPSPGALSSKWMKSPRTVFWLHRQTLQQRKRSELARVQVHACTDTHVRAQTGTLPAHLPHTSFILILSLPFSHSQQSEGQRAVITEEARRCMREGMERRGKERRGNDSLRQGTSCSLLSHQKC